MIKQVMNSCDLNTVEGRGQALRMATPIVAKIRDRVIRDGYARELAGWLGMDPNDVAREIRSTTPRTTPLTPGSAVAADTVREDAPYQMSSLSQDPVTALERDGLMVLLQHPDLVEIERASAILATQFSHGALALVRDAMVSAFEFYPTPQWVTKVTEETPAALSTLVGQLAVGPLPEQAHQASRYCDGVTSSLLDRELLRKKAEVLGALQRSDPTGDPANYRALQESLVGLERDRRELRGE